MDLLERLLGHDSWTTRQLLDKAADGGACRLERRMLDRFDAGPRTSASSGRETVDRRSY